MQAAAPPVLGGAALLRFDFSLSKVRTQHALRGADAFIFA
jgi:hypothetical protein